MEVGIDTAGQFCMSPVAAPFTRVAVHVAEAPGVGGIAAYFRGAAERRAWFGTVIRLALEICLFAAELVAERGGGSRAGAAGIFPLSFGGQPELPVAGKLTSLATKLGEFLAERLGFGKVDIADGQIIAC